MNKRLIILIVAILIMAQIFLLSSCGNSTSNVILETETPSSTPSPQPSDPATLTSTPYPTLTPTPVPITIQEAIQRGTFAELEVFNKGQITYSAFSPDGLQFVAITKRGMYVYNVDSWQELFSAPLSPKVFITSINYSVDGLLFAAGDSSGIITFWDTQTWKVHNSFQVHKGEVTSLDISPDNLNFVIIGDKKEISVWNMSDGSLVKSQFRSKDSGPAYYSLDGKWLYISEANQNLIIWSSEELTLTNRLGQLGKRSPFQAISPYTNTAAVFGYDTIILYDFDKKETTELELENYPRPSEFRINPNPIEYLINPNGKTFMMFLDEKSLMVKVKDSDDYHLIDLVSHAIANLSLEALSKKTFKNPELLHILKSEEIKALGFEKLGSIQNITSDGTGLILSGRDEIPSGVFDLNQKIMIKKDAIQEFPWASSAFLSDGTLAGVDWTRPIRVPPFSNKEQQGEFTITILSPESQFAVKSKVKQNYDLPDYIDRATISPNGKVLAVGTADGNLYFWNLDAKELIATIKPHNKDVGMFGFYGAYWGLFFDEDGSHLTTLGQDGKIKVLNLEDLSEVISVNGENPVLSPDGSHLAYVSSDGSIRLVSLFNEYAPKVFRGNINRVSSIAFSVDGTLLFSGDYNNDWSNADRQSKLKVWSISDETLLLDLPQYNIISFLISPDGTRLYIPDGDGVISVWGHQEN
jgi:WD40 repeat protein